MAPPLLHPNLLLGAAALLHLLAAANAIGVNYGTLADNLPPPSQVADFIKSKTIIDRVKLYDSNPDIIRAFAGTGVGVTITATNDQIIALAQPAAAQQWVAANVKPFVPATNIIRVLVGNEVLQWGPQNIIDNLVGAMRAVRAALDAAGLKNIQVSTAHSLGILLPSWPPSAGKFRPGWDTGVIAPILDFHRRTKSPFMVNPYPYFGANATSLRFCVFQFAGGLPDGGTRLVYTNMFDALLDTTMAAMRLLGYGDVEIAVGETGWPTVAEGLPFVTPGTAQAYNGNLVRKVNAGGGTPMMPGRRFEVYLFSLFVENLKPGPLAERNFGLFRPDFSPVYDAGLLRNAPVQQQQQAQPQQQQQQQAQPQQQQQQHQPTNGLGKWCVSKAGATPAQLQTNIDWVCRQGVDCGPIQPNGACFMPNDPLHHANFAMNAWYQSKGHQPASCDFSGTGSVVSNDPSYGGCKFPVAA